MAECKLFTKTGQKTIAYHFQTHFEKALKLKQMSISNRRHFLSSIASAVFAFEKYPSREDYNCVARTIISHYPFLKAPTGA